MVTAAEAKRIVRDWVEEEASKTPGFQGAFLIGSINWRTEDEPMPPTSDVDVRIVVDIDDHELIAEQGLRQQIRSIQGVTLDFGFDPISRVGTPEQVLGNYTLACHFSVPNILSDPSGHLTKIQKAVEKHYAQRRWLTERVERARVHTLEVLHDLQMSDDVVGSVTPLFFAVMGMTQIPAVADLRNPTMRKCLVVFLELVERQRKRPLHESVLKFLGSDAMDRKAVERHHRDLVTVFDRAVEIAQSPSIGDFVNITARPVVIAGSWELIEDGFHREAMLWILSMRALCQATIEKDASDREKAQYAQRYKEFLVELGLASVEDSKKRAQYGERLLEEVMQVAEEIIETNPKVSE